MDIFAKQQWHCVAEQRRHERHVGAYATTSKSTYIAMSLTCSTQFDQSTTQNICYTQHTRQSQLPLYVLYPYGFSSSGMWKC
jgi:hypothetical protein